MTICRKTIFVGLPDDNRTVCRHDGAGQRMRTKPGQIVRVHLRRGGHECGAFPGNMAIVVVDKHPQQKPGFSRIHGPADHCLNGECADANGYDIEQNDIQQHDLAAVRAYACRDDRLISDRTGRALSKPADHAERRIHLRNRGPGRR